LHARFWIDNWINREDMRLISRKYDSLMIHVCHDDCQQSHIGCMYSEWCVFEAVYYGSWNDNPDAHTIRFVAWTRLVIIKHEFLSTKKSRRFHSALVSPCVRFTIADVYWNFIFCMLKEMLSKHDAFICTFIYFLWNINCRLEWIHV